MCVYILLNGQEKTAQKVRRCLLRSGLCKTVIYNLKVDVNYVRLGLIDIKI